MELTAIVGLALATGWLLARQDEGLGPWLLALLWLGLTAWSLFLGVVSLPLGVMIWLLFRRRRNRRELVQFVNQPGWTAVPAPPGFTRAWEGDGVRVLAGPSGVALQRLEGESPARWLGRLPRASVLRARAQEPEPRPRRVNPWALALGGVAVAAVAASQWIAWEKLRVFPAEPSLLLRSLSSLPRMVGVLPVGQHPALAAGPDRLAIAFPDQPIALHGLDGSALPPLPDSTGWTPAAFAGPEVVACNPDGRVRLWPDRPLGNQLGPTALACSDDLVACGGKGCEVVIYRRQGGVVARMTRPGAPVSALACQGSRAVCGTETGELFLFELASGRPLAEREGDGTPVRGIALVGDRVVTAGDRGCQAWSAALEPGEKYTEQAAVALAADSERVCVGFPDGSIEVYGATRLRLVGHQAPVVSLALRGTRLYSGSNDGTVKLWKLD